MDIAEKKEIAVECYSRTYDKRLAYRKALFSSEEIDAVEKDEDFQQRLSYYLILKREALVTQLSNLSTSDNEKISLSATLELGKIIYPDSFSGTLHKDDRGSITSQDVEEFFNAECGN